MCYNVKCFYTALLFRLVYLLQSPGGDCSAVCSGAIRACLFRGCNRADVFAAGVAKALPKLFSRHQAEPVGHRVASLGCLFRVC